MPKRAWKNSLRRRGGFTLIEALAAGLILSLTGMAIGGAVVQSMQSASIARNYERGTELLEDVLVRIDLIGPARIYSEGPRAGRFEPPHDQFEWRSTVEPLISGDLYDIQVSVTWPHGRGRRTVSAHTRLNDPPKSRNAFLRWEDL